MATIKSLKKRSPIGNFQMRIFHSLGLKAETLISKKMCMVYDSDIFSHIGELVAIATECGIPSECIEVTPNGMVVEMP